MFESDTLVSSVWPALIRSAIIPGWGQIEQEHPDRAIIFYGLGLSFLYNMAYNYQWYQKTDKYVYKTKVRRYGLLYLNLYAINLADVIESHRKRQDRPWAEDMFSDEPQKSPWGAVTRSAMLPGWGQCYNESYIKSVIAFGSFAYFAGKVYNYDQNYKKTGDTTYRDSRVLNSWYLGLTYFLVMVDSYVDAYLYRFDETVKLTYLYLPENDGLSLGVHIVF